MEVLRRSGAPYLSALFLAVVASQFAHFLSPDQPILKGQPAGVLTAYALVAVAVVLWWLFQPEDSWPAPFGWFMAALAAMWVAAMGLSIVHGDLFDLTALLPAVAFAMIWMKKPGLQAVFRAGEAFAWGLIAIAVAAQVLDAAGIHALHYEGWNRWPILTDLIGPMGRWEGPFGNVNHAGPIGAFLIVFGLFRHGANRVAFVLAGGIIVFVSDSRASILATAVGLVVALLIVPSVGPVRITRWMRIAAPLALFAAFAVYVFGVDPTVNGRTDVWSEFLSLWTQSPVTGIGGSGIQQAIGFGDLPAWANHGHSMLIDPFVRYGVVGLAAVLAVAVLACWVAVKAAGRGFAASAAILATFLAGGLTEDLVDWRYLGEQLVPMLLAVMLGACWLVVGRKADA